MSNISKSLCIICSLVIYDVNSSESSANESYNLRFAGLRLLGRTLYTF